jgi:2-keto-4-pentenoate hydratase/2-oxohepta-3-ene-1,7-dioic acid hydratase in catechol pathway
MHTSRRSFLKGASAAGLAAASGASGLLAGQDAAEPDGPVAAPEMPRGLTLLTISRNGKFSLGVKTPIGILDVTVAARILHRKVPLQIDDVIRGGDQGLSALVETALTSPPAATAFVDESRIAFGPCVTNPEKILMLGFNYRKHAIETGTPIPTTPVLFTKCNNALSGHNGVIRLPSQVARQFDYEVELVLVIGRTASNVKAKDALSYVFGYCTGNDFSARDLQYKDGARSQFLLGKTCDGFAPIGPYLVTADQIPDPQKLKLECRVNGERRQSGNTSDMIFSCAEIISYASRYMTLKPGDIFFTGTPEGVIRGMPKKKRVWLKAGDKISTSVERLGELRFDLA